MKNNRRTYAKTLPGSGRLRCHCGCDTVLRPANEVCKGTKPGTMAYVCVQYPRYDSYVLAETDTLRPMGSLVGPELRRLRMEAHRSFDQLHQSGLMSKRKAYEWLSYTVQAPMAHAHIGHLGEYYCQVVIRESEKLLAERAGHGALSKKTTGGKCNGTH